VVQGEALTCANTVSVSNSTVTIPSLQQVQLATNNGASVADSAQHLSRRASSINSFKAN
jgi:hypothetical protein